MSSRDGRFKILVVEDAFLIGMDLKMSLEEMGFEVLGPVPTSARALDILERDGCDGAILDVSLGRETSESVADYMVSHGIPFFFLTGYSRNNINDPSLQDKPLYHKPMNRESLGQAVATHLTNDRAA
ncbi:MAG: hypothetical protein P8J89_07265 [Phycisphaerales bacterium]|nr:hypothetical protein [Phycisphaerales bacterium]|tara:strand:- start:7667 stop:8047 length:381 start_codon:yes stop_codon:yes gene_type:complete